ncbi:MAG: hypothetical protein JXB05_22305 [Myxococcaceae bacterium]|nr:hypothetical protein [Myxococcaceae bacterium]
MGSLLNGRGRLGPTMIGGALGLALSTTFIAVTEEGDLWYAAALGPPIGALIGYELFTSHERSQREQDEEAYAGLQLMPVVGRLPKGGILGGLVGRF